MASTIGRIFRVTTFGESHGDCVGAIVDGCPPRLELTEADIQTQLDRRRPGQSDLTTPRSEKDQVTILSGIQAGLTLGTPIGLSVPNEDRRPQDYGNQKEIPRPSHADYSYKEKYGILARSGGGRASARETIGRVAAGAIADKLLRERHGAEIVAWVGSVGDIEAPNLLDEPITRADVDSTRVRCPHAETAARMDERIASIRDAGDSIGGTITCVCRGVPVGWGEPVFDKMEAALARAMLSIPATKGFEIGTGFAGTRMQGSQHNDPFVFENGRMRTRTNNSGGVQGGITNGELIYFRVAFKPVATISLPQETVDYDGETTVLEMEGRHDPCVLPRAVPIVESMAALVMADMALVAGVWK